MSENDPEILKEFLVESHENLDRLDRDLVALETDPRDRDRLGSIFRTIHTMKGTAGFLALGKLESLTHAGENLLSRLRDGLLVLDADMTTALLAMIDAVRKMLAEVESNGSDGNGEYGDLIARIARHTEGVSTAASAAPSLVVRNGATGVSEIEPADGEVRSGAADASLRVDVSLLDKLMNLVGELVLARNQILQFNGTLQDAGFAGTTQRLNLITSELQEGVMKTRMQPIGNIWGKFPRIVRDLAHSMGKQVRIEMQGKETDLDKTIIEAIKDPLTHVVRNAVDHGIESPAARTASGKNAEGRLLLRAFHEGGQVNIEISDDGAGLNLERVRSKAIERGLITPDRAARMSDHELARLIFLPGFSTAEKITNVSGRGVGMDVVKTNVEKIGGTVDVTSQPGAGTTLRIKIPLTLAIIPALIVTSAEERFAIPQVNLLELVRLEGDGVRRGIEEIRGARFYRLRGNLLPLVYLDEVLGQEQAASDVVNIVVLKADGRHFGLVVQGINDTEEIVVKPLGKQLKELTLYAGATIMGDGKVALILDVVRIAQHANLIAEGEEREAANAASVDGNEGGTVQTLLLFRSSVSDRMAIPLSMVARLEEFPRSDIEHAGEQEVVQYRGGILPLVHLATFFGVEPPAVRDLVQVVVFSEQGMSAGLVVDRILDIVHEPVAIRHPARKRGLLGSAIVQQKVTDLVDVRTVVQCALAAEIQPVAMEA